MTLTDGGGQCAKMNLPFAPNPFAGRRSPSAKALDGRPVSENCVCIGGARRASAWSPAPHFPGVSLPELPLDVVRRFHIDNRILCSGSRPELACLRHHQQRVLPRVDGDVERSPNPVPVAVDRLWLPVIFINDVDDAITIASGIDD